MTEQEMMEAFEKMLMPIKELYSEITTRGNQFCYPFIYTDADGDHNVDASNSLKLCYDRSTGALYEGSAGTVDKTKNISEIRVSNGTRNYKIEIIAKTGKVIGRY